MKVSKVLLTAAAATVVSSAAWAATLDDVKGKGHIQCGVTTGLAGFSAPNDAGEWAGFDTDVCRALGAAIFNDTQAVKFTPTTGVDRFPALQSGEVL